MSTDINEAKYRDLMVGTIARRLNGLTTEELLDLLGHLIIRERKGRLPDLQTPPQ